MRKGVVAGIVRVGVDDCESSSENASNLSFFPFISLDLLLSHPPTPTTTHPNHNWQNFSTFKDACDYIGSTWIIQDTISILKTITVVGRILKMFLLSGYSIKQ